jgi:trimethylamine--corrinoid protein Co-methyltransferase
VLIYGATAQLARQYGLPAYAPSHMHTTVLGGRSPFQAGALRKLSYQNACLTGLDLTTGPGSMNGNSTVSPEQLLIDHDLWGISGRYLAGIRTDEESLALDAIERVGPGGHFLTDEHTLRWLRSDEHFYSRLFDPERLAAEGKTIYAQAHEQVEEILGRHRPAVPATAAAAIERYVGEWTARSGSRPAHAGPGSGEMEP